MRRKGKVESIGKRLDSRYVCKKAKKIGAESKT